MEIKRQIMALEDREDLGVMQHGVYMVDSLTESVFNCWVLGRVVAIPSQIVCYVFDKWEAGRYIESKVEVQYFSQNFKQWIYFGMGNTPLKSKDILEFEPDTLFRISPTNNYVGFKVEDAMGLMGRELVEKKEVGVNWARGSGPREYKIYGYKVVMALDTNTYLLYFIVSGVEYEASHALRKFVFKDTEEPFGKIKN